MSASATLPCPSYEKKKKRVQRKMHASDSGTVRT